MSTPLGIGLSIDFGKLDADLGKVADRIDKVGKDSTVKVGTFSGQQAAKSDMGEVGAQFATVGVKLSQGLSSGVAMGVRASTAMMLGFVVKINSSLERLTNTTITMFERIDAAMKFPKWDQFITKVSMGFGGISSGARKFLDMMRGGGDKAGESMTKAQKAAERALKKTMKPLDSALGGGMGQIMQGVAQVFNALFVRLGNQIADTMKAVAAEITLAMGKAAVDIAASMKAALASIADDLDRLGGTAKSTEADIAAVMSVPEKAASPSRFPVQAERKGIGRALGANILQPKSLPAPIQAAKDFIGNIPQPKMLQEFLAVLRQTPAAFAAMGTSAARAMNSLFPGITQAPRMLAETTVTAVRLGASFASAGALGVRWLFRMTNFMSSLGGVTKKTGSWIALLGLVPAGIAAKGITMFGKAAMWALGFIPGMASSAASGVATVGTSAVVAAKGLSLMGMAATALSMIPSPASIPIGAYLLGAKALGFLYQKFRGAKDGSDSLSASMGKMTGETSLFGRTVTTLANPVQSLGKAFSSLGAQMLAAFGVVGVVYKLVEFFKKGVQGAAALNETVNVSKSVFGDAFGPLAAQADMLSTKYGVLRNETMQVQAGFGAMAQGAGMSEAKTASFAESMTARTIDFAREWQLSFAEAADKIKSGLGGQGRALKEYGVFIDDDAVKADALAKGMGTVAAATSKAHRQLATHASIKKVGDHGFSTVEKVKAAPKAGGGGHAKLAVDMTKASEVAARADIIMKGLAYTEGALERTSAGASAQFKKAGGGVSEFATRVGEMLLPAVAAGAEGLNLLLGGVLDLVQKGAPLFSAWSEAAAGNVRSVIVAVQEFGPKVASGLTWAWEQAKQGPLGFVNVALEKMYEFGSAIPEAIGIGIRNAGTLWEIAKLKFGEFAENLMRRAGTWPENFKRIWDWLGRNWFNLMTFFLRSYKTMGGNLLENAARLGEAIINKTAGKGWKMEWVGLLEGFKSNLEKLPDMVDPVLIDVGGKVKELYDKLGQDELSRQDKISAAAAAGALARAQAAAAAASGIGSIAAAAVGAAIPPDASAKTHKKPGEAAEPPKAAEYKLAAAVEIGSKEAYSIIARSQAGGRTGDPAKQAVQLHKDGNRSLNEIAQNTKRPAGPSGFLIVIK